MRLKERMWLLNGSLLDYFGFLVMLNCASLEWYYLVVEVERSFGVLGLNFIHYDSYNSFSTKVISPLWGIRRLFEPQFLGRKRTK